MAKARTITDITRDLTACRKAVEVAQGQLAALQERASELLRELRVASREMETALGVHAGKQDGRHVVRTLSMDLAVCAGQKVRFARRLGKNRAEAREMAVVAMNALAERRGETVPREALQKLDGRLEREFEEHSGPGSRRSSKR